MLFPCSHYRVMLMLLNRSKSTSLKCLLLIIAVAFSDRLESILRVHKGKDMPTTLERNTGDSRGRTGD